MSFFQNMLLGAGSIMNVFPETPKRKKKLYKPFSSDYEAIENDFRQVGNDLLNVIIYEQKKQKEAECTR